MNKDNLDKNNNDISNTDKNNLPYLKIILIGILFIIIQSFLQQYELFKEIYSTYIGYLTPLIYAFFTAIFLDPLVEKIKNKTNIRHFLAVLIAVFIVLILCIGFFSIVVPQILDSFKELYQKLPMMQEQGGILAQKIIEYLKTKGLLIMGDQEIESTLLNFFKRNIVKIRNFGFSVLLNMFWWTVALTKLFIGFFLGILILIDKEYFINIYNKFLCLVFGKDRGSFLIDISEKSKKLLLSYLWGRLVVSFIVSGIVLVITFLFGVPYAFLSSIMILIGNMIPYIGSIIAGGISIFLVLLAEPSKVMILLIAILVAQAFDAWIIGPKIVSDTVGVKSFWVILAIFIGGSLFGPIGMFFGVPCLCIIKLFYNVLLEKRGLK